MVEVEEVVEVVQVEVMLAAKLDVAETTPFTCRDQGSKQARPCKLTKPLHYDYYHYYYHYYKNNHHQYNYYSNYYYYYYYYNYYYYHYHNYYRKVKTMKPTLLPLPLPTGRESRSIQL